MAMLLTKIVKDTKSGSAADLQTTEAIAERTYGLWQVFKDVRKESDWRKPRNPPRGWKSKVKWHLLKEFDSALGKEEDDFSFDAADVEVAGRRRERALLQRQLDVEDEAGDHQLPWELPAEGS